MKRLKRLLGPMSVCGAALGAAACGAGEDGSNSGGLAKAHDEIIGGTLAPAGSIPYQVWLAFPSTYLQTGTCGGSLISDRWVVTAAHCVADWAGGPSAVTVVLGDTNRTVTEGTEIVRVASRVIPHRYWDKSKTQNDIALVELSSPVTFSSAIQPIALSSGRLTTPGTNLIASGWGRTSSTATTTSNELRTVTLPLVDDYTCAMTMWQMPVRPSMICAGYADGNKGTCHGDSGGPLASVLPNGTRQLEGIVSWGNGSECSAYSVFTRVADYVPWIREVTLGQPRFACQGQTMPTTTPWQTVSTEMIAAVVDTSPCGYEQTPEYFTALGGTNLDKASGSNAILQPTATGFGVYVYKPGGITPQQAHDWQWHVNWTSAPTNQVNSSFCTGSTSEGATNWVQAPNGRIYVDVDTSRCGRWFTPKYFTSLKGALMTQYLSGVTSVYSPTATGFRVYLEWGSAPAPISLTPNLANLYRWHIAWAAAASGATNDSALCTGSSPSGFWNWTQAGTDLIYTTVDTSACGRTRWPLYFTSLRGNGLFGDHSGAVGATSLQSITPTSFRVYLRQPGLTPLVAGTRQYYFDWLSFP